MEAILEDRDIEFVDEDVKNAFLVAASGVQADAGEIADVLESILANKRKSECGTAELEAVQAALMKKFSSGGAMFMMTPASRKPNSTPTSARSRGPMTPSPPTHGTPGAPGTNTSRGSALTPAGVKRTRPMTPAFTPPSSSARRASAVTPGSNTSMSTAALSARINRVRSQGWKGSGARDDPVIPTPPALTSSNAYTNRANDGQVLAQWTSPGFAVPKGAADEPHLKPSSQHGVQVTPGLHPMLLAASAAAHGLDTDELASAASDATPFRYMGATLASRADAANSALRVFKESMLAHMPELRVQLGTLGQASQIEAVYIGRVITDGEGKLNAKAALLEGSRESAAGARVALDLTALNGMSLFPGQCVALRARSPTGTTLVVSEVLQAPPAPAGALPASVVSEEIEAAVAKAQDPNAASAGVLSARAGGPLRVWVAAGPYTLSSDLNYEPLDDLLHEVQTASPSPDVLILAGPFVDMLHPSIQGGDIRMRAADGKELHLDARLLMAARIFGRVQSTLAVAMPALRIVMLPSDRDALAQPVFPGPPLAQVPADQPDHPVWADLGVRSHELARMLCLTGNPGLLTLGSGGMATTLGVTATDVLFDMNKSDVYKLPAGVSRPSRTRVLAGHLLEQRSWYPLNPAPAGSPVDSTLPAARMPLAPDILVLPSRLPPAVELIHGTLVINPGTLSKASAGGSYAQLEVYPPVHTPAPLPVPGLDPSAATADNAVVPSAGAFRARVTVRKI